MAKKINERNLEERIAQNLKELRKMYDITQEELAKISGLPRSTIVKCESGHGGVTLANILVLCNAFGEQPSAILKGWEECL